MVWQGVFSKNTDTILAFVSLVFDIGSVFIPNYFAGTAVSILGELLPKVIAMRIEGFVVC